MGVKRSYRSTRIEYTTSYTGMRGVDFNSRNGAARRNRFAYLENMYKDYSGGGSGVTESIPGYRRVRAYEKKINAIHVQKDSLGKEIAIIHAADSLYRLPISDIDKATPNTPIITLEDTKSKSFLSGSDIYVIDGKSMIRIREDGTAARVGDDLDVKPYVPTTFINGKEYEQRNLLTNRFKERYTITVASDFPVASEGLSYKVISAEKKTAAVIGLAPEVSGTIYIPAYISINGERYDVSEIADNAFYAREEITNVILSDSVKKIGRTAFYGCRSLVMVICRDALERIEGNAFLGCDSLSRFHIGAGIQYIGAAAFHGCTKLKSISCALDEESFLAIDGMNATEGITIAYSTVYNAANLEFPIFSEALDVTEVTVGGAGAVDYYLKFNGENASAIIISCTDKNALDGKEICISGILNETSFTKSDAGKNFIAESEGKISGKDAILGCRVCEIFDGRIFLSGNPALPNTVFYTARDATGRNNPTYFGVLNYFNDGEGSFPVTSLLSAGDSLAVFKSGDDGGGSIYYHVPKETEVNILPKIYPVSYIHSGVCSLGESITFFDDPLFLSSLGCTALDKKRIDLERSVTTRSTNVNSRLLSEDLSKVSLARWCGYLVLLAEGRIYLADSRDIYTNNRGYAEYEWYFLNGIGAFRSGKRIFKYSEIPHPGFLAMADKANTEIEEGEVYLNITEDKETVYYVKINGKKYEVYTEGEIRGGVFYPATTVASTEGDLLFFGTDIGDVCVFNNDKRGVPPTFVAGGRDFNADEYKEQYGNKIHPYFYSFDGHAPLYALSTPKDDCGMPNMTKSTVKNSLSAKIRCLGTGNICCEVGSDRAGYKEIAKLPDYTLNFSELDFSAISFANTESLTLPIKERERGWIEKSVTLYSNKYASAFGLYSICYRFTVKGKIKN